MKRLTILFSLLLITVLSIAQNQASVWYFGSDGLRFNPDNSVTPFKTGAQLSSQGGSSIISDANGCVLFYASDSSVYNRHNSLMPNGKGIKNERGGKLIIPFPDSDSLFYLFSVMKTYGENPATLYYSMIDMSLDGRDGDVIKGEKNIPILNECMQRFTCIQHKNGIDYWLIAREYKSADFVSFLITKNGIEKQVRTTIGTYYPYSDLDTFINKTQALGVLKASPDGSWLAMTNAQFNNEPDSVFLFNFNNETGIFSNKITLVDDAYGYGDNFAMEFSPNSQVFYRANNEYEAIVQYDLSTNNQATIQASRYEMKHITVIIAEDHMQLGPNGKIYYFSEEKYIGVINNPNKLGAACNLNREQIHFTSRIFFNFSSFVAGLKYTNGAFLNDTCIKLNPNGSTGNADTIYFVETVNAFSPNGDGLNDLFTLVTNKQVYNFAIIIYNRWGQILFKSEDINQGWDGTYQGTPVIQGVYFYIIKYRETPDGEQQTKAGTVHLIR